MKTFIRDKAEKGQICWFICAVSLSLLLCSFAPLLGCDVIFQSNYIDFCIKMMFFGWTYMWWTGLQLTFFSILETFLWHFFVDDMMILFIQVKLKLGRHSYGNLPTIIFYFSFSRSNSPTEFTIRKYMAVNEIFNIDNVIQWSLQEVVDGFFGAFLKPVLFSLIQWNYIHCLFSWVL